MTRRLQLPAAVQDWIVALGVTVALLITAWSRYPIAGGETHPAGYALLAAGGLSLAAARRAPVLVLAGTGLSTLGHQSFGLDVPAIAFPFAVYAATRAGRRAAALVATVVLLVALPLAILFGGDGLDAALAQSRDALEIAWLIAAAAAGEALRQSERRAEAAERTREEVARRRADEERLRIARELHDSLTHQISVIKVQADVAVHVARRRGDTVPSPLLAIQDAGREAARELRATLGALRDDTAPPLGIAQLPDLVERSRGLGLDVRLDAGPGPLDAPSAIDRTAYRVVQEALTNVAKHSGAGTATVGIHRDAGLLVITVDDAGPPGRAAASPGGRGTPAPARPARPAADTAEPAGGLGILGLGILGMRERVTALGGTLDAGPRPGGGFTLRAELPLSAPVGAAS